MTAPDTTKLKDALLADVAAARRPRFPGGSCASQRSASKGRDHRSYEGPRSASIRTRPARSAGQALNQRQGSGAFRHRRPSRPICRMPSNWMLGSSTRPWTSLCRSSSRDRWAICIRSARSPWTKCIAIFGEMGFSVAEGPDIEDDFHNFDRAEHSARASGPPDARHLLSERGEG